MGRPAGKPGQRRLAPLAAAALLALLSFDGTSFVAGVPPRRLGPEAADVPLTAMRVSQGGRGGHSVVLLRPKAKGFRPSNDPTPRDLSPIMPSISQQDKRFVAFVKQGHPVSEVFMRFEGVTPWKRVGEITHPEGDFVEAVRAQRVLLIEHSYYLFKKARFWLPTEHPIQFGYADERAQIVPVEDSLPKEGTEPAALREMLLKSGFHGALKPRGWRRMKTNMKDNDFSKKDHHKKRPHLMDRVWNMGIQAHRWYNPDKYRGTYNQVIKYKRGLVTGNSVSR